VIPIRDTIATFLRHVCFAAYLLALAGSAVAQNGPVTVERAIELHLQGMAIDIGLPGREIDEVRRAARALQRGGVGFYPKSDFVRVDTGRVRFW
jgi:hypothetical protein